MNRTWQTSALASERPLTASTSDPGATFSKVTAEPKHQSAEIDGMEVAWLEMGEGPLAICLHGFPDSAPTWRHLLPELAAAGYRAVAPWTRGYAPSAIPADGFYETGIRARDICRLHEHLGGESDAVIIGHDWGAGTATVAAVVEPDRWAKVVTMAVPPGGRVGAAFFQYRQLRRSSYMFFFQHPLSETIIPHDDWAFIHGIWQDWSPGYDGAADVANFVAAASPEGHLAATLGYYRATFQPDLRAPDLGEWQAAGSAVPTQPMLYLHGRNDGCIGAEVAEGVEADLPAGSQAITFDGLGHFLHLEDPALVNRTILDFLS